MLLVCAPLLLLLSCRRDFLGDANSNNLIRVSESLEDEGKSHIKEERDNRLLKHSVGWTPESVVVVVVPFSPERIINKSSASVT